MIFLNLSDERIPLFVKNFCQTSEHYALYNEVVFLDRQTTRRSRFKYQIKDHVDILRDHKLFDESIYLIYDCFQDLLFLKHSFVNCKIYIMQPVFFEEQKLHLTSIFSKNEVIFLFTQTTCSLDGQGFELRTTTAVSKKLVEQNIVYIDTETVKSFGNKGILEIIERENLADFNNLKRIETGCSLKAGFWSRLLNIKPDFNARITSNLFKIEQSKCFVSHRIDSFESALAINLKKFLKI